MDESIYSEAMHAAAEEGIFIAQYYLGLCYRFGDGVEMDLVQAYEWILRSANQCYSEAQFYIGVCYLIGDVVEKNEVVANKWFLLAAEQNHVKSQFNLALNYANGSSIIRNWKEAYFWALIANANGVEKANKIMETISNVMTADQIDFIQTKASLWYENHR